MLIAVLLDIVVGDSIGRAVTPVQCPSACVSVLWTVVTLTPGQGSVNALRYRAGRLFRWLFDLHCGIPHVPQWTYGLFVLHYRGYPLFDAS